VDGRSLPRLPGDSAALLSGIGCRSTRERPGDAEFVSAHDSPQSPPLVFGAADRLRRRILAPSIISASYRRPLTSHGSRHRTVCLFLLFPTDRPSPAVGYRCRSEAAIETASLRICRLLAIYRPEFFAAVSPSVHARFDLVRCGMLCSYRGHGRFSLPIHSFAMRKRLRMAMKPSLIVPASAVIAIAAYLVPAPLGAPVTPTDYQSFDALPEWYVLPSTAR